MFLADIWRPLDLVLSETSKLPTSIGSIDGISRSGTPLTNNGRRVSMLFFTQPGRSGSVRWHIFKKSAIKKWMVEKLKKKVEEKSYKKIN